MKHLSMTPELYEYFLACQPPEHPVLAKVRAETTDHPLARMQIPREQGHLLSLLVTLIGAKNVLEIGVFTGYSSLAMALALPSDGHLVGCDISEEFTAVARKHWQLAEVDNKITLFLAPALQTLDGLLESGKVGSFDFAFIDADKTGYGEYYERVLHLLRPSGLMAIDNVLWSGRVAAPAEMDEDTCALREFNARLAQDERVQMCMLGVADGLTLALKR